MKRELAEVIRRNLAAAERPGIADDAARLIDAALGAVREKFAALRCPRCELTGLVVGDRATEPTGDLWSAVVTFAPACPLCGWRPGASTALEDAGNG